MTAAEWESRPRACLLRPVVAVEFLRESGRWPTVTQRNLANRVRAKQLKNFGSKQRPLYSKGNLITLVERLCDDSIERRANGSFRINMENMQHGRAA